MRGNDESQKNEPQTVDRHAYILSHTRAWAAIPERAIRSLPGFDWDWDCFYDLLLVGARPTCHEEFKLENHHRRTGRALDHSP